MDLSYLAPNIARATTVDIKTAAARNLVPTVGSHLYLYPTQDCYITFGSGNTNAAAPTASAAATQTLTSAGVFSGGETVTIGTTVYTFRAALTPLPFEVLIGANQTASHANLKAAINNEAGAGSTYASGTTVHPTVECTSATGTTDVLIAKTPGTAGNSIATTETCANASFGAGTLAGGTDGAVTALPLTAKVPVIIKKPDAGLYLSCVRASADGVLSVIPLG